MAYVKMNDNYSHLSLGNLFNIIKYYVKNKDNAIQSEIFCVLFDIDNINDTTVNNYCTGYRSIGNDYKQKYINYQRRYQKNKETMIPIICNMLSLVNGYHYDNLTISEINQNEMFINITKRLFLIAKNDIYVNTQSINELIINNNYYDAFNIMLFHIVLNNIQPISNSDTINETISSILNKTNISLSDLQEYLKLQLADGLSYKTKLKRLADNGNIYACYLIGRMFYNGEYSGDGDYKNALNYLKIAADANHPHANWIIANMIIKGRIGNKSNDDYQNAWNYLNTANKLGSIAAINTMGLCYLNGYGVNKDVNKALEYFLEASHHNYPYAYNNIGKIYENKNKLDIAYEYYLKSALLDESWALNKVGYMSYHGIGIKKDINNAFIYFNKSVNAPKDELCLDALLNLANYFYKNGNSDILLAKDEIKYQELIDKYYKLIKKDN